MNNKKQLQNPTKKIVKNKQSNKKGHHNSYEKKPGRIPDSEKTKISLDQMGDQIN